MIESPDDILADFESQKDVLQRIDSENDVLLQELDSIRKLEQAISRSIGVGKWTLLLEEKIVQLKVKIYAQKSQTSKIRNRIEKEEAELMRKVVPMLIEQGVEEIACKEEKRDEALIKVENANDKVPKP